MTMNNICKKCNYNGFTPNSTKALCCYGYRMEGKKPCDLCDIGKFKKKVKPIK